MAMATTSMITTIIKTITTDTSLPHTLVYSPETIEVSLNNVRCHFVSTLQINIIVMMDGVELCLSFLQFTHTENLKERSRILAATRLSRHMAGTTLYRQVKGHQSDEMFSFVLQFSLL